MAQCKVSVVVPVYKAEQFLDRCVESFLKQTFSEFELLLVDDGSPDNCPRFCDEWAQRDDRIRVIHKKNGGPQDAVKHGVALAEGEYIAFADSDDWVEPDFLKMLYEGITGYGADVAQCNFRQISGEQVWELRSAFRVVEEKEIRESWLPKMAEYAQPEMNNVRWSKIYRASLLKKALELCEPSVMIGEDYLMNYAMFGLSRKTVVLDTPPLYNYIINEGSIMNSYHPDKMLKQDAFFRNLKEIVEAYNCPAVDIDYLKNREYMAYIYARAITSQDRAARKREIETILAALDKKIWRPLIKTRTVAAERICLHLCSWGQVNLMLLLVDIMKKWKGIE